jgi:hypothetical protein
MEKPGAKRNCKAMQTDAAAERGKKKEKMQVEPTRVSARRAGNEMTKFISDQTLTNLKLDNSITSFKQYHDKLIFILQTHPLESEFEIKQIQDYNVMLNSIGANRENMLIEIKNKQNQLENELKENEEGIKAKDNVTIREGAILRIRSDLTKIKKLDTDVTHIEHTDFTEIIDEPEPESELNIDVYTFFGSFVLANLKDFKEKNNLQKLVNKIKIINKLYVQKTYNLTKEHNVYMLTQKSVHCDTINKNHDLYKNSKENLFAFALNLDESSKQTQLLNETNENLQKNYDNLSATLSKSGNFYRFSQHIKEQILIHVENHPSLLSAYLDTNIDGIDNIVYEIDILQFIDLLKQNKITLHDSAENTDGTKIIDDIKTIADLANTSDNIDSFLEHLQALSINKDKEEVPRTQEETEISGAGRKSSIKQGIKKQTPAQKAKEAERKEKEKLKQKAIKEKEKLKKQKEAAKVKERALKEKLKQKAIKEKEKLKKQKEAIKKKEQLQKEKRLAKEKLQKAEKAKAKTPTRNATTKKRASLVQKKKASTK